MIQQLKRSSPILLAENQGAKLCSSFQIVYGCLSLCGVCDIRKNKVALRTSLKDYITKELINFHSPS